MTLLCFYMWAVGQDPGARVDFDRDVAPLLRDHCLKCHGPEKPKGQLRLDSRAFALKGGFSGPALVPGKGDASLLVKLLLEEDADSRMPQKAPPLPRERVDLLRRWIDQGAVWAGKDAGESLVRKHWAYLKPRRPDPPSVNRTGWARNPIDAFVLARLEKEGLSPSPEAPKEKLLRRLSLALTGLPPDVRELDAFLSDSNPDAYERAVDRLLASPHYGERWARPWLDLARYADSNGYEKDAPRSLWKWRDWLIDALNRDLPFTRFTVEQIAGDLLADATLDQKVATGFHRNGMLNEEDGVDREEARWNTLVERVGTTATVWLGTTLACAQCHNHKYDPLSQADFYRILAFFENTDDVTLEVPTPAQEARRRALREELAKVEEALLRPTPEIDQARERWEEEQRRVLSGWKILKPSRATSVQGVTLSCRDDGSVLAGGENPETDVYTVVARPGRSGLTAFRLEVLPDDSLPRSGPGRAPSGDFVLSEFKVFADGRPAPLRKPVASFESKHAWIGQTLDGDPATGWAVAPKTGRRHVATFETEAPPGEGAELTFVLEHRSGHPYHTIGKFRLWAVAAGGATPAPRLPEPIRALLERPSASLGPDEKEEVVRHFRSIAPELEPLRARASELRREIQALGIPTTWALSEKPGSGQLSTLLRHRGNFLAPRERVPAGLPAVLAQGGVTDRLAFARWLVSEENPLAARVAVNRAWEQLFGRGLVETPEDFGTQGAAPSHPELLEWLSTEFVRLGWSPKALHRMIVTSATYRQSSIATPDLLEKDPYNRLLARGASFRLDAETIRDAALAAGGILSRKIGGPSVFPHQPDGVWKIAASNAAWTPSAGEDRTRRGLYTFWRRSAPYPSFATFDAPSRETCTARRARTSTPLQALTLLNDPAFFEAARGLAKRMAEEGGKDVRARLACGFRRTLSRSPDSGELDILERLYDRERARSGDEAALTLAANTLLNLDEMIVKD